MSFQKDSVSITTAATYAFAGSSAPSLDWTITIDARGLTAYNLAGAGGAWGQIASRFWREKGTMLGKRHLRFAHSRG